jgi:hypothetical protein
MLTGVVAVVGSSASAEDLEHGYETTPPNRPIVDDIWCDYDEWGFFRSYVVSWRVGAGELSIIGSIDAPPTSDTEFPFLTSDVPLSVWAYDPVSTLTSEPITVLSEWLPGCDESHYNGLLRVATSPAVPSQALVGGVAMNSWGLTWVKMEESSYVVSFTDVQGFSTPDPETVSVVDGATTTVTGVFVPRGWLQVSTSPAVPATIFVDGFAMNDWGVWTDLAPGSYEVCFGDVADFTTPGCETVLVSAGASTLVEGAFVSSPGSAGPVGHGFLRVTTDPAVAAQILVDGVARDTWGLNWLKLAPGDYEVSFTDIQGFTTPGAVTVTVSEGATTVVEGVYVARGWLQVSTSPALPGTVYVDGVPRNDWGMWTDLPVGTCHVHFGNVAGFTAPADETAVVSAGGNTPVTGIYTPDP